MKDFFSSALHRSSGIKVFEVVCEKMKLVKMEKFEVCFDCLDDSPVYAMGLELAVQDGRHRIS